MKSCCRSLFGLIAVGWWSAALAVDPEHISSSSVTLDNPRDVRLSSDERFLFVSDGDNDRIVTLDPKSLSLINHFGGDELDGPQGLDVDTDGQLYVADSHHNRIVIYDISDGPGQLVGVISGKLSKPRGVAVDDNAVVYVAGAWSRNIVAYQNTDLVGELKDLGTPSDIEWTSKGDLWIADTSRNELLRIDGDLMIKSKLGGRGLLRAPYAVSLTDRQHLVVSEKHAHQVKILSTDGDVLGVIGTRQPGGGPNELRMPEGIETNAAFVWIADSGNDRIVLYRLRDM